MDWREATFRTVLGLTAKHGGGAAFLGDYESAAVEAYRKSLIGSAFPSFWLEVPLVGAPGFDLHVYYDRGDVLPDDRFEHGRGFGMQALFDWYFGSDVGGVGVGFAHDLREGAAYSTGAYVNFNKHPLTDWGDFFRALGAEDAIGHTEALLQRLPERWSTWYLGLFPQRAGSPTRVGAFVSRDKQAAYAADKNLLARDLAQAGFTAVDDALLDCVAELSAMPYQLELQLDATAEGTGDTLGVDLTLEMRSAKSVREAFAEGGAGARACELLESWGIADDRWHNIAGASTARIVPLASAEGKTSVLLTCVPSFIKVKWAGARIQPAKVYFNCDARIIPT